MTNINLLRAGAYTVVITNNFGAVTSAVAMLNVDENLTFRLLELRTSGAIILEVNTITGDDRGGMAVGGTNVFLTGDTRKSLTSASKRLVRLAPPIPWETARRPWPTAAARSRH